MRARPGHAERNCPPAPLVEILMDHVNGGLLRFCHQSRHWRPGYPFQGFADVHQVCKVGSKNRVGFVQNLEVIPILGRVLCRYIFQLVELLHHDRVQLVKMHFFALIAGDLFRYAIESGLDFGSPTGIPPLSVVAHKDHTELFRFMVAGCDVLPEAVVGFVVPAEVQAPGVAHADTLVRIDPLDFPAIALNRVADGVYELEMPSDHLVVARILHCPAALKRIW